MAITTMDGLVSAMASAQLADTYEASITTVASDFFSLWTAGGHPSAGAAPTTGVVPTSATTGAIPFSNPGGSNTLYLARLAISDSVANTFMLSDRLSHMGGLSGTSTSAQTATTAAINRTYNGVEVGQAWLEWYTATGSTATTATVSYTNQSGTSGRSGTAAVPASAKAGLMVPVTLQSGDTAVESVQTVTLAASTLTAGNFGVTLTQRLATIPQSLANVGQTLDYAQVGLPQIAANACLFWHLLCTTTSSGVIVSELTLAQG